VTKKSERARTSTEDDDETEDAIEHLLALEALEDEAEPTEAECAWADALAERARAEVDAMLQNVTHASPPPKRS
jgi:hypothetical protein